MHRLRARLSRPRRHPGAARRRGPPARLTRPARRWPWFDESRLDDESTLTAPTPRCGCWPSPGHGCAGRPSRPGRPVRGRGASREQARPRAVVAAGPDSRLLRAALEPWCPVPFVAWPNPGLPGWAGGLDLVVVLAPDGGDVGTARRSPRPSAAGARSWSPAPERSLVAEHAAGRWSTSCRPPPATSSPRPCWCSSTSTASTSVRRPTTSRSPMRSTRSRRLLAAPRHRRQPRQDAGDRARRSQPGRLGRFGARRPRSPTGRGVDPPGQRPHRDRGRRRAPVAGHRGGAPRNVFDDPFTDEPAELRPVLVVLDDGADDPLIREQRGRLQAAAAEHGVRTETVDTDATWRSPATPPCC